MGGIDDVITEMKGAGVDFVTIIPCIAIKDLVAEIERTFPTFAVTREEEALGLCAGAYLAGKVPCMVMQNSGIGNSVNALKSLFELYGIPLLMIVSHRGQDNEWIEGQKPMGVATPRLLDALDIPYFVPDETNIGAIVGKAVAASRERSKAAAVLIRPGVLS